MILQFASERWANGLADPLQARCNSYHCFRRLTPADPPTIA
jgi:hypothetical protein